MSGFFSSFFGRDCADIEVDPKADPFEKEICHTFRHFEDNFMNLKPSVEFEVPEQQQHEHTPSDDPKSLRDSILSRPAQQGHGSREVERKSSRYCPDEDLDSQIESNPSLLDRYSGRNGDDLTPRGTRHHSSYSRVTISTSRKPDGTMEERRTVKDSDGNEEVTITRVFSDGTQTSDRSMSDTPTMREDYHQPGTFFGRLSDWIWSR